MVKVVALSELEFDQLSELRNANRVLTTAREEYESLFAGGRNPTLLIGLNNRITAINDSAVEVLLVGETPGEHGYGHIDLREALPWLPLEGGLAGGYGLSAGGVPTDKVLQVSLETTEGPRDYDVRSAPMLDDRGKFTGTVVTLVDVTDARRREAKIIRLTRLIATLSAVNKMVGRVTDRQELLDEVCQICVENGGFHLAAIRMVDPHGASPKVVAQYGHDDGYLARATDHMDSAPDAGSPASIAIRTGERCVVRDVASAPDTAPWRDVALRHGFGSGGAFPLRIGGETIGCLVLYSVTARFAREDELLLLDEIAGDISFGLTAIEHVKRREESAAKLRESRLLLEGILDSIPTRVFWKDRNLVFLGCNAVFARDAGFVDPQDIIGKTDYQMGWADQAERYRADDRLVIESGLPRLLIEEPQTAPDGRTLTLLTSKMPLRSPGGETIGLLATYMDITERHLAEEASRLASVGQLAAGVAHDFNNLLMSMGGAAELVEEGTWEPGRLVDAVQRATLRGSEITTNLMAFARPDKPRRAAGRLEASLDAALTVADRQLANAEVTVVRQYPAARTVVFDAGRMEQVFLNLIINACHAMAGGGTLTISTEYSPPGSDAGEAIIRVSDTGTGIAPENLDHIFDPFFTTKGVLGESDTPGSGLGLSVSHGLVRAHGGTLSVRSELGEGTTFEIRLPLTEEAVPEEAVVADAAEALEARARLKGARVLVAEDDINVITILQRILDGAGCELTTAATAGEAIEALRLQKFDLVLSDLMMPDGGGRAVTEFCQTLGDEAPSVIVMTGRLERALHDEVMGLGAVRTIEKPFRLKDMLGLLADVMASRGR